MYERYNDFHSVYTRVVEAVQLAETYPNRYDRHQLNYEMMNIKRVKIKYEENIIKETNKFIEAYKNECSIILDRYKLLIKSINEKESEKLCLLINYFN